MLRELNYYLKSQSTSVARYILEQTIMTLLGGLPGLIGVGLRGMAYKLLLKADGLPLIEHNVRLLCPANILLGRQVYLDIL